jgi:hypothetical protein
VRAVKYLHKNQVKDAQLFLLNEVLVCGTPKAKKEHKYKFLFQVSILLPHALVMRVGHALTHARALLRLTCLQLSRWTTRPASEVDLPLPTHHASTLKRSSLLSPPPPS